MLAEVLFPVIRDLIDPATDPQGNAEKEFYADCYEAVVPKLVPGGILVADNAISHAETLQPMLDRALSDERVDALIVPIGKGELVCRRI